MPKAGATKGGRAAQPLPVAARRRIWDAVWDRLLAPTAGERQGGDAPDRVERSEGDRPAPEADCRPREEAA